MFDALYAHSSLNWRFWKNDIADEQDLALAVAALQGAKVVRQWESVDPSCTVVDVITNPRITPVLETARERGCRIVDGVELLVQLAMQIFERWTGITPEESVFQAAVAAALGES